MIRRSLLSLCCATAAWGALAQEPAGVEAPHSVHVVPGDLADALEALARQLGVNMIYPSGQLRGYRTGGVRGSFSVRDAFRRLLDGTPLVLSEQGGAWLVSLPPIAGKRPGGNAAMPDKRGEPSRTPANFTSNDDIDFALEEVVVTGTYIRRAAAATSASPVQEVSRAELRAQAPHSVADAIAALPANANSTFGVGRGLGSVNGAGSLNLRGLGADATLVLLNSRRVARDPVTASIVDINALLPQIAIGRIEILKDGASSLYGSDAVAGVVNFISRQNFEGAEIAAEGGIRETGGTGDYRVSGIWGARGERTRMMVAAELNERERYHHETLAVIAERDGSIEAQLRQNGWPARFIVANRDVNGTVAGAPTMLADPSCASFTGSSVAGGSVRRLGVVYPVTCQQNVAMGTSANADQGRRQVFAELHHEISPGLRASFEFGALRNRVALADTPGGAVNPAPGHPPVIVPGYAPGNTFRAATVSGALLYAQPSRVQLGFDKDGDGRNEVVPLRGADGSVLLNLGADGIAGTPDDRVGGMPFWEDAVVASGSRIFGLSCNLPGDPASRFNCRNQINQTRAQVDATRASATIEGAWRGGWTWEVAYTKAENHEDQTSFGSSFSMPALRAALAGYGGDGCYSGETDPLRSTRTPGTGPCEFFNLFGNAVTSSPVSAAANTRAIGEYVSAMDWSRFRTTARVVDVLVGGPLLGLPAGPLRIAAGAQQRSETWVADYSAIKNRGDDDLQAPFFDKNVRQSANAAFLELSVPLLRSDAFGYAEFSGALRHENVAGEGLRTTDPKLGLLYESGDATWRLRGTFGTSFLAPSLYQRYRQNGAFANGVDDYYTGQNDNLARIPSEILGNPRLKPQKSRSYNLGATVQFPASVSVDVDFWSFRFDDQIALESALALALDPGSALDPEKVLRDTAAGSVIRNGVDIGQITGFNLSYVNNARLEAEGLDLGLTQVTQAGAWGDLSNTLLVTWQTRYAVNGEDRLGSRNARVTGASFSVPVRATLRTAWARGAHAAQSLLRFTSGYRNDAVPNAGTSVKPRVEAFGAWDLSYTYGLDAVRVGLRGATISLGLNNVLDAVPPWVPDGNHTLASMYDYSGRNYWLRLTARL